MTRVSFRVIHVRTLIIATIVAISAAIVIGVVVYGIVRSGHEHISGIGAGHEPAAASRVRPSQRGPLVPPTVPVVLARRTCAAATPSAYLYAMKQFPSRHCPFIGRHRPSR